MSWSSGVFGSVNCAVVFAHSHDTEEMLYVRMVDKVFCQFAKVFLVSVCNSIDGKVEGVTEVSNV